jgi:PIN domain nuclease of toxin-antitoxin system
MNYLLDTHAVIWFLNGDKALSDKARKTIESDKVNSFVCIASIWEMAIKSQGTALTPHSPAVPATVPVFFQVLLHLSGLWGG